jgi:hypothetical protein
VKTAIIPAPKGLKNSDAVAIVLDPHWPPKESDLAAIVAAGKKRAAKQGKRLKASREAVASSKEDSNL